MKTYSVKLRVYRGKKVYDKGANGEAIVSSPNQYMDLSPYLSMEWNNWLSNATNVGFTDAEVVEVRDIVYTENTKRDGKECEMYITTTYPTVAEGDPIISEIKAAVKSAFDTSVKVVLSPEQQKIADMEAEMAEMRALLKDGVTTKKAEPKKEVVKESTGNDDLSALKVRYEEVFNKKPYHSWDSETLQQKIDAKLAE